MIDYLQLGLSFLLGLGGGVILNRQLLSGGNKQYKQRLQADFNRKIIGMISNLNPDITRCVVGNLDFVDPSYQQLMELRHLTNAISGDLSPEMNNLLTDYIDLVAKYETTMRGIAIQHTPQLGATQMLWNIEIREGSLTQVLTQARELANP